MKKFSKFFAFLLCFAIVLSLYTGTAFADDSAEEGAVISEVLSAEEDAAHAAAADNDELLEEYLEASVSTDNAAAYSTYGRNHLSGLNLLVYDTMRTKIGQIADGKISDTIIKMSIKELGLGKKYTAKDLGVSAIVEGGAISPKATAAMSALLQQIDISKIMTALLFDCPSELYWYDKVPGKGAHLQYSTGITATTKDGSGEYVLYFSGESRIEIQLEVAQEYTDGAFSVDDTKIAGVQSAIANAKALVQQNADKSDYEKLLNYKNSICSLVSYNSDAIKEDLPYGNPWQLIWVFDGDPSTNVVCEGYSKAFQFLCDASTFAVPAVSSRLVTGVMSGGTGAGNHMWNLVTMEDGKNYVVDVTNSDSGTKGSKGQLFLAGLAPGQSMEAVNETFAIPIDLSSSDYIWYKYDPETISNYDAADLLVSTGNYEESESADYSGVEAALKTVPADLSPYTDESANAVRTAVGNVVYHMTISYQKEVDDMAAAVTKAVKNLKVKPDGLYLSGGVLKYFEGGVFAKKTGMVKRPSDNKWYYVKNGVFEKTTGVVTRIRDGKEFYVQDGKFTKVTGFVKRVSNGKWCYVENGAYKKATGIVKRPDNGKFYYVENGEYNNKVTGVAKRISDGKQLYVKNGQFTKVTSLVKRISDNTWVYVANGVFQNKDGMVQRTDTGKWYYVEKGIYKKATGLVKRIDNGKWYYVEKGTLKKVTGGVKRVSDGKLFYVEKGVLKKASGLAKRVDNGKWIYFKAGTYDGTFTGTAVRIGEGAKKYKVVKGKAAN